MVRAGEATGSRASSYPSPMIRSNHLGGWIPMNFALVFTSVSHLSPVSERGWIYTQCNRGWKTSALNSCQFLSESPSRDSRPKWYWLSWASEGLPERQINVISMPDHRGKGLFSCPDAAPTRAVLQPQPVGCWFCFHYLLFTALHTTRSISCICMFLLPRAESAGSLLQQGASVPAGHWNPVMFCLTGENSFLSVCHITVLLPISPCKQETALLNVISIESKWCLCLISSGLRLYQQAHCWSCICRNILGHLSLTDSCLLH